MILGYARCSTEDQNLDWQIDALNRQVCERIFQEKITGISRRALYKYINLRKEKQASGK